MEYPIQKTLACFTKICIDKKEIPCFDGQNLINFFYKNKKDYPEILGNIHFNEIYRTSEQIDLELWSLEVSRMVVSWGLDFHPYETSKAMLIKYDKIPADEKKKLNKLAKKFYKILGCNRSGRHKKHTKFNSLDNLS